MLQCGYKQPSRFGRWCPVKVDAVTTDHIPIGKITFEVFSDVVFFFLIYCHCLLQLEEGDCLQPLHGPGFPMYPAIYRQFVYFLSSQRAREQFMRHPMIYLKLPSPKPVVPIRMAIVGPPKSGKTARECSNELDK